MVSKDFNRLLSSLEYFSLAFIQLNGMISGFVTRVYLSKNENILMMFYILYFNCCYCFVHLSNNLTFQKDYTIILIKTTKKLVHQEEDDMDTAVFKGDIRNYESIMEN